jgi:serine/threonine-protein kinase
VTKASKAIGALLVAASATTTTVPALAQSATEVSLAESLYRKARELMHAQNYDEACPKFAESYRLDPATGTLLNLATCHEAQGKLATAWLEYSDALVASRRAGRQSRVKFAEERIAAIEPRLSRLTLQVAPEADDPNLQISLDGHAIGRAAVGIPTPVDPGRHLVEARAPGKKPWSESVEVGPNADQKTVTVPALDHAPGSAPGTAPPAVTTAPLPPPLRPQPPRDEAPARPTPESVYIAGGATIALAAATTATSIVYLQQRSSYNDEGRHNPDVEAAADEQDSLRTLGVVNAVLWIATAGSAALTGYLYFTRPERPRDTAGLSLRVDPTGVGISVAGHL